MNTRQDMAENKQHASQDDTEITRRNMLHGLGVAAAPAGMAASAAAMDMPPSSTVPPVADLIDGRFASASGRHFGSQVIHHGEQKGYQVTPISQDKASPGYQRPCNLNNPTVASLLRKVVEMDGTEAAAGGPCGMGIISQTYMALLRPMDAFLVTQGVEWNMDAVHKNLGRHVKLIINQTRLGDPVTRIMARKEETDRSIPARYTRVSIGLEEPEDLIADFKQAIEKCG
jgi:cystathionine beta-lyase/cystathionine gamma-synthase